MLKKESRYKYCSNCGGKHWSEEYSLDLGVIYNFFRENPRGQLTVKMHGKPIWLPGFYQTTVGLREGSIAQYRDRNRYNSLHIREYPDSLQIHMDKANPDFDPVGHFVLDFDSIVNTFFN